MLSLRHGNVIRDTYLEGKGEFAVVVRSYEHSQPGCRDRFNILSPGGIDQLPSDQQLL